MYVTRDPSPTLSNLPPDIIHIVLRKQGQPIDSLRLISPTWNVIVLEYLSHRKNHQPISLLQFDHCDTTEFVIVSIETDYYLPIPNCDIHQSGWTTFISDQYNFAVKSPSLRVRVSPLKEGDLLLISATIFTIGSLDFSEYPILYPLYLLLLLFAVFLILLLIGWTGYHAYLRLFINPKVQQNVRRLEQIAARCSYIDCLAFYYIDPPTLEVLRVSLADVAVNCLWMIDLTIRQKMRKHIIEMVRINNVKAVSIYITNFNEKTLREIHSDFYRKRITLEIWENAFTVVPGKIFGHPSEFWNDLVREISEEEMEVEFFTDRIDENWQLRFKMHDI